ncbi:AbrB family transcriptional regulator [Fructilactobacillus myrtifloralis]|uniref:AbrB family transcriptional regulator n=1 Tax=Fructilactobacillus myrtifloralis TaxID=2940301 RepID=A0ABY5BNJ5_9LACO|nr:AbrB family transcriptional regulator [Fructilactobacillus myrtifloralis]USS84668.1 AbrB family transcriptional regulator [Fructilactobacillus myrtifloralis]
MNALKLKRFGNSHGIIIPKTILKQIGVTDVANQLFNIDIDSNNGKIILSKKKKNNSSEFDELFEGFDLKSYKKENPDDFVEHWGKSVGKEAI